MVYSFDSTGTSAANLVNNDIQDVSGLFLYNGQYLVLPAYAPYFGSGLIITYNDGVHPTRTLVLNTDYTLAFPFWAATRSIGLPIFGGILLNASITTGTISLSYQTLGGIWNGNNAIVSQNLANQDTDPRVVIWDVITDVQSLFPQVNNPLDFPTVTSSTNEPNDIWTLNQSIIDLATKIASRQQPTFNNTTYAPFVIGSSTVSPLGISTYEIANYTSAYTYTVDVIGGIGSVSISNSIITYTAPNAVGVYGFTVNGIDVPVVVIGILAPSITAPVNGANISTTSTTITSNPFSSNDPNITYTSTNWELATDSGFTNIVQQSLNDTVNQTSWSISGLTGGTTYYVRIQYNGSNNAQSSWSASISFTVTAVSIPTVESAELIASNGTTNISFGWSVAINSTGDVVIIGVPNETIGSNSRQGAAYIFTNSGGTWSQTAELTASDGAAGDFFGQAVALDSTGTIALIGAYDKTVGPVIGQGVTYVFTNSGGTWSQIAELVSSSGTTNGNFGNSVAFNSTGTIALIGAYFAN